MTPMMKYSDECSELFLLYTSSKTLSETLFTTLNFSIAKNINPMNRGCIEDE
jgi:hypothetical protein